MCRHCPKLVRKATIQLLEDPRRRLLLRSAAAIGVLATAGLGGALAQAVRADEPISTPVYRFKIGDFDCASISDGALEFPSAWYGANATPAEVADLLEKNFLPRDIVRNPTNSLYIDTGSQKILIDSGLTRTLSAQAGPLAEALSGMGLLQARLAAAGLAPGEIDLVVITHGHPDHVGGILDGNGTPIFPNARYVMDRTEFAYWQGVDNPRDFTTMVAKAGLLAMGSKLHLIAPGDEIVPGLKTIDAYGHTPGHLAFEITSGSDTLLHLVDASGHYVIGLAEPSWSMSFDMDATKAIAVRRALFDRAAQDRALTFASHFPWPGLGHVTVEGSGWAWNAVAWETNRQ